MTPEQIVRFIRQHDPCHASLTAEGRILVSTEVIDAQGNVSREMESIPATLEAARDWLGY